MSKKAEPSADEVVTAVAEPSAAYAAAPTTFSEIASAVEAPLIKRLTPPEAHANDGDSVEKRARFADKIGICLSGLCVVHCLLTPFVILLIPSIQVSEYHEWFHDALLVILPIIAVSAFWPGYRRHRDPVVFWWSLPGLALIALGALAFQDHAWGQVLFSVAGSLLLIRAHLANRKLCACCAGHAH